MKNKIPFRNELMRKNAPMQLLHEVADLDLRTFLQKCNTPKNLLWVMQNKAGTDGFPGIRKLQIILLFLVFGSYLLLIFIPVNKVKNLWLFLLKKTIKNG